ncbi:(2Fe-2S)-binding protein [Sphingosinicellaceae bacterium]|nr:(2Fe-2S)-binding protein [Sphingosinicellaceae bacterium]
MRIEDSVTRGPGLDILVDGRVVPAFGGETLATTLIAAGISAFRDDSRDRPRGLFCNMGTCCECFVRVTVPGRAARDVRACLTLVAAGMAVELARHD